MLSGLTPGIIKFQICVVRPLYYAVFGKKLTDNVHTLVIKSVFPIFYFMV